MKKATKQTFLPGWNEKKVRELIAYYDQQTAEEEAAEIETAPQATGETWISVPTELGRAIARFIEKSEKKPRTTGDETAAWCNPPETAHCNMSTGKGPGLSRYKKSCMNSCTLKGWSRI